MPIIGTIPGHGIAKISWWVDRLRVERWGLQDHQHQECQKSMDYPSSKPYQTTRCQMLVLNRQIGCQRVFSGGDWRNINTNMLQNMTKSYPSNHHRFNRPPNPTITATGDHFDRQFVSPHCFLAKPPIPNSHR